jgi:TP901 family phage tail tape measure protein
VSTLAGGKIDILIDPDTRDFDSKLAAGLKGTAGVAGKVGKGIALALAAGVAVAGFGLSAAIAKGKEYEANLNELQAVSQATALDMKRVGDTAKALGADMSLPATSAADAAAAMVELAKGGLTVDEAMKAAKGTLQLAAAAQIDGAQAAEIQSNSLNAFRLSADQAGRVADVLANTANAAAGTIVDIGNSMKFVAPVSAALGVSIEHTAAAIGLLANQGIKGEQAGTSLRGILASLASPSKAAAKALDQLGVSAFDQQGKFVGLRAFTDQLAKAKGRLTEAEFAAAASTAFGNEGFTAANALAAEGAKAFDEMTTSVSRAGGAADVAAAKTKGLGGALEGFQSQVETAGIGIFEKIAPTLEKGVRAASDVVAKITPAVVSGIDKAVAAGQVFGPRLAEAIKDRGVVVGSAVREVLGPIAQTIPGILNAGINAAIGLWEDFTDVLGNVVDAAKPVANGIAAVAKAAIEADGPLSAAGAAVGILGDAVRIASGVLIPIGMIVGGIAEAFADLPGPIQSAIITFGLLAAFRGPLSSLGDTVSNRVTAPFKRMGEEVRLQQALLTGSTNIMSSQIGKVGFAMAALESRVPVIGRMAEAYRSGSTAAEGFVRTHTGLVSASLAIQGASERTVGAVQGAGNALGTFTGVIAGTTRAVGSGLRSALTGLVGFLGGPWGIALAAAGVGLSLLAGKQQKAAADAAAHKATVAGLAEALRRGGEQAARTDLANKLAGEFQKGAEAAKAFGIGMQDIVNFAITGKAPTEQFTAKIAELKAIIESDPLSSQARQAALVISTLGTLQSGYQGAIESNKILDEAIRSGNVSMLDATGQGRDLSAAMGVLADKTSSADDKARALKDALDALSGGEIGLEAAQSRLNEQLARLGEVFGENVDKTKGWGAALLNADGSINTTRDNGRRLFDSLRDISGSMAEVAQRTFDTARAQGDDLPTAMGKAKAAAEGTKKSFIDQHESMGLTADQAKILGERYGLLPDKVATLITAPGMDSTQLEMIILRDLINKVPPDKPIVVRSLSDEAKKKLEDIGFTVRTLPDGDVEILARDQNARGTLNNLVNDFQNRSITIQARVAINTAAVAKEIRMSALLGEKGHIVRSYADGGFERKLTPMRAGMAQIVPPNTWRVVGDRLRDDEAYIPINRSSRSLALLQETARRMGVDTIRRFALGGIAGQSASVVSTPAGPLIIENHIEVGGEVVRVVRTEIRDANRATRQRVLAGAGGQL